MMLLGGKIKYNTLQMGNKKNTAIMLGNKINDQSNRRVLQTISPNLVMRTSPIEKYNRNI
jgi:hypothetical protein